MLRTPPSSTLFPYTTLFRSDLLEVRGKTIVVGVALPHHGIDPVDLGNSPDQVLEIEPVVSRRIRVGRPHGDLVLAHVLSYCGDLGDFGVPIPGLADPGPHHLVAIGIEFSSGSLDDDSESLRAVSGDIDSLPPVDQVGLCAHVTVRPFLCPGRSGPWLRSSGSGRDRIR